MCDKKGLLYGVSVVTMRNRLGMGVSENRGP